MATKKQQKEFADDLYGHVFCGLGKIIEWITENLEPDDVWNRERLRQWAIDKFKVEKDNY